jgi:acyl dehydratase
MLIDPKMIGTTSEPQEFEVEKGHIRRFAEALGDPNPLFIDEAYAKSCGYPSVLAPPTFPTTFRVPIPIDVDYARFLHGEQEYSYTRPICAGDVIRCVSKIANVFEKKTSLGEVTFLVSDLIGTDLQGNPVFTGRSTAIIH